ncbi:HpcH/HpaI aldolase/citrate lyase family protein [Stakelama tenebrarum]|uniref:CoA ester lyase n=1 Tax=Stakelama tenebrarum TaxID=2711215 RepID=A0A6G6Y6T5_9SPHN|nr:CoA ester lyase [Sphingosinithalassobacter tenebrarum]QIG80561.1 CoA ester lyase [Sphingosinithalassobacter tenebrarum]
MATKTRIAPRTALFLPASNPRALAKARTLDADLIILDLEDAVKPEDKESAREAAAEALAEGFGGKPVAVRINGETTPHHGPDMIAMRTTSADYIVVPKAETVKSVDNVFSVTMKPLLTMIETPLGVFGARDIAARTHVHGLIAGTNDLRAEIGIPASSSRAGLLLSLQMIVLAASAGDAWALDGVYNALDDAEGLRAECHAGRALGFDGKTLIHPNQIVPARDAFSPTQEELEEARALVEAAKGGAERFRDRMIEEMHVAQARQLLARAER